MFSPAVDVFAAGPSRFFLQLLVLFKILLLVWLQLLSQQKAISWSQPKENFRSIIFNLDTIQVSALLYTLSEINYEWKL
jgi:hypothetical protein